MHICIAICNIVPVLLVIISPAAAPTGPTGGNEKLAFDTHGRTESDNNQPFTGQDSGIKIFACAVVQNLVLRQYCALRRSDATPSARPLPERQKSAGETIKHRVIQRTDSGETAGPRAVERVG